MGRWMNGLRPFLLSTIGKAIWKDLEKMRYKKEKDNLDVPLGTQPPKIHEHAAANNGRTTIPRTLIFSIQGF